MRVCSKKSDELHDDLVLLLRAVTGHHRPVLFRAAEAEVSFLVLFVSYADSGATSSIAVVNPRIVVILPTRTYNACQILPSDIIVQQIGV